MSPGGISVLERGIRRAPYRDTVALLCEALDPRLAGYIDVRIAALGTVRQATEQIEYDRMLDILANTFDADELQTLMADGAAMDEDRAIEEALRA